MTGYGSHMSLRLVALTVVVAVVAAACGDPSTEVASEASAVTNAAAPAVEAASATTEATTEATTAPVETPPPTDAVAMTIAPDGTTASGAGDEDLDWVFASDPFPSQADAATDPDVATEAIIWAYRHWILLDLDPAVRARILENGEANTDRIEETMRAVEGTIRDAGFEVDQVDLTGVDSAQVRFRITWQGQPSPIFPDPMTGTAVYRDGSWRVGGRTLCLLTIGVGQECGADERLAPLAYRVTGLPADAERMPEYDEQGQELAPSVDDDVVVVPGYASWWPEGSMPYVGEAGPLLDIRTLWLPDAASLTDEDLTVLVRARWGGAGGPIVAIAGGRGRAENSGGGARLLVVRPDDVIVDVSSSELTVDELAAMVLALEPVDPAA